MGDAAFASNCLGPTGALVGQADMHAERLPQSFLGRIQRQRDISEDLPGKKKELPREKQACSCRSSRGRPRQTLFPSQVPIGEGAVSATDSILDTFGSRASRGRITCDSRDRRVAGRVRAVFGVASRSSWRAMVMRALMTRGVGVRAFRCGAQSAWRAIQSIPAALRRAGARGAQDARRAPSVIPMALKPSSAPSGFRRRARVGPSSAGRALNCAV